MNNKVLVKINMPQMDLQFDVFIPVNEIVWKIKKMLLKAISDLSDIKFDIDNNFSLINEDSDLIYNDNDIIIDTDIRNGTKLMIFLIQ